MTLGATTWSPGLRDMNSAVAAAMPEEKTRAPCPPSSLFSSAST